ncbi:TIR domain-containing protein [Gracilibacillus orientalis]|uniref:TIR domain-containing protein n=1 Tax=Gracilibacillus orientalis TaxID=334253 RepID=A0A1I4J3Y0_9BACI|nr:RNA-binding domain-containing protein [Gracilibacillus orientalis]SFL61305.1 TIR domain-containing protein [Gracilibacillus orientalis]
MSIDFDELLENPQRGNIRYIHPGEDKDTIAKMISALANSAGGTLLFGIYDDGCKLHVKGNAFDIPKMQDLVKILNGFDRFNIMETKVKDKSILQIDVQQKVLGVKCHNILYTFYSEYHNRMQEIKPVKIFISYNHLVSELADIVEENINKTYGPKVLISRDTQLQYRDNIDKFMETIKENDVIISLISDSYLKSEACMYEIIELMRDPEYHQRLAFIISSECDLKLFHNQPARDNLVPKIYGAQRFDYIKYWTSKLEDYIERLNELQAHYTSTLELNGAIRRIGKISDGVGEFLDFLNKTMGQDFSTMLQNDFIEINKMINQSLDD